MAPANNPDRSGTPPSEIKVDQGLVHSLLKDQHADLAHLPIYFEQEGWDNVIFRLGKELAIRLPRRQAATIPKQHGNGPVDGQSSLRYCCWTPAW
jgi:hypothetical protein